jgi:DNA-binding transcriptional LysR family regulator
MKLQHLRFFVAVVECGGVGKAAQRLHISQPALSAGLKALEEELGRPLFERQAGKRSMRLAPRALSFYQRALEILAQCEAARTDFRGDAQQAPRLRVGVMPTVPSAGVAALAHWFATNAAHWRLRVREGSPAELAAWLRQERIDVAWTVLESRAGAHVLWQEPFVVMGSPRHPLAHRRGRALTVKDLNDQPLILRGSCELKSGQLREAGLMMKVVAQAARDELALKLAAQGLGLLLAPRSLATPDVAVLPVKGLSLARTVGLVWREGLPAEAVTAVMQATASLHVASA